jgi:hypothetical protein
VVIWGAKMIFFLKKKRSCTVDGVHCRFLFLFF